MVQDNFTREDKKFGIQNREMFILFLMEGTALYFESRALLHAKVKRLPHVVITLKGPWNLMNIQLGAKRMGLHYVWG